MSKKILVDLSGSIKLQLTESSNAKDGKFLIARGEFGRADVATQNNRKYPKTIWDREIKKMQEAIQAGKVLGELDHPCLTSDDFRVLTLDGWKDFRNVSVGDKVWSLKNGEAIVSTVDRVIDQPYEGDVYEFDGKNIKATFTPAHKFVLSKRYGGGEFTATAQEIAENRNSYTHSPIPKTAVFNRGKTDFVIIPGSSEANPNKTKNDVSKDLVLDAKLFAAFMGIYLAEGGTSSETSDNWNIHISQKNEWSRRYIFEEVLSQFPDEMQWTEEKSGFHLADARLYRYLKDLGDQYSRYVPKEVKLLDADCLKEFIFWFMIGDGRCVASGNRDSYSDDHTVKESVANQVRVGDIPSRIRRDIFSVSERLVRDIHECLVLSGGSGSVSILEPDKDYKFADRIIEAKNKVPLYQLHISTVNGTYLTKKISITKKYHTGNIYCLTTTHGNFYIEHKGRAFWTGNSDGKTSLKRVSHIITNLGLTEDGVIIGEAKILDNEYGRQLRSILEAGGAIGVSSRGMGSTAPGSDGMEVVQEDFQYITHDFVADPAVLTSYPSFQMEVSWLGKPVITEKGDSTMETVVEQKVEEVKVEPKVELPVVEKTEEPKLEESKLEEAEAELHVDAALNDGELKHALKAVKEVKGVVSALDGKYDEKMGHHVLKVRTKGSPDMAAMKQLVSDVLKDSGKKVVMSVKENGDEPLKAPEADEPKVDAPPAAVVVPVVISEPKAEEPKEEAATPKEALKGEEELEVVNALDDTCSIWKSKDGFFWYDKHLGQISEKFFVSEKDAEKDAKDAGVLKCMKESKAEVSAFKVALESIKTVVKPFLTEESHLSELKAKDEEIELLKAKLEEQELKNKLSEKLIEEAVAVAEHLSTKVFILESLQSESDEDRKLITSFLGHMNQFLVVEQAEKALEEAKKKASKKKKELKEQEEKFQSFKTESIDKLKKLEGSLKESVELNKKLGLHVYLEKRVAGNPNAEKIKKLCEGKSTKEEIDLIIEKHTIASESSSEYNSIRKRLSIPQTLVEDHLKETEPKKGLVAEGVEGEMAGLFLGADLGEVKKLM